MWQPETTQAASQQVKHIGGDVNMPSKSQPGSMLAQLRLIACWLPLRCQLCADTEAATCTTKTLMCCVLTPQLGTQHISVFVVNVASTSSKGHQHQH